jgi:hypothetical protein
MIVDRIAQGKFEYIRALSIAFDVHDIQFNVIAASAR